MDGLDEEMVKAYIRNQEEQDECCVQMKLPMAIAAFEALT